MPALGRIRDRMPSLVEQNGQDRPFAHSPDAKREPCRCVYRAAEILRLLDLAELILKRPVSSIVKASVTVQLPVAKSKITADRTMMASIRTLQNTNR